MENASKALIMAAGVLIGLLMLSLAVYLFTSFASTSAEVHKENEKQQIDQFNSQFTSYVGSESITIYDVVTVANLATETNKYYEYDKRNNQTTGNDNYITVTLENQSLPIEYGSNTTATTITNAYNTLIINDLIQIGPGPTNREDLPKYNCQVNISQATRKSLSGTIYKKTVKRKEK